MAREGSKADRKADAKASKGMSPAAYERSAKDKDRPTRQVPARDGLKKFARGIRAI
jgi:hypothetical protein